MILDYKKFHPVKTAGIFFLLFALVIGVAFALSYLRKPDFESGYLFFLIMFLLHLLTGVGILLQKTWGYYLLKFYLCLMVLGFPIGTYFGMKSLKYIKENEIKNFFSKKVLHI